MYTGRGKIHHEFTCDYGRSPRCHGEIAFDDVGFDIAILMLRDEHWQSYREPGVVGYSHTCPACVEEKKRQGWQKMKASLK